MADLAGIGNAKTLGNQGAVLLVDVLKAGYRDRKSFDQLATELKPDEIEKAKAAAQAYTFKTK